MRQINVLEGKVVAPEGMKVGIVASRFNEIIVNKLLGGAVDGLVRHGVEDINRFTKDDVVCALEMFNEDYVTFPRDDIAKLSGLTMPVNKRNWRKQPVHLQGARAIQEINDKANGTNWREGNGRPKGSGTAQARVYEWRQQHPEGRKADCHRETGLDPKTVRKWWDCPPPAVRFENGHITVRVSPSQELSDWLLDALHDGGQE